MLFVIALLLALLWLPSPLGWIVVGAAVVAELGEIAFWHRWSKRRRAHVGTETLPGRRATVVLACRPDGQVRIDGELWQARCADGADPGDEVEIEQVEGLRLLVRRP